MTKTYTPHKHADILRAIAEGIPVQAHYHSSPEKGWQDIDTNLAFSIFLSGDVEYRIKPKPKVKKWRWVYEAMDGGLKVSEIHYQGEKDWFYSMRLIQKIESTMIEVEQND